MLGRHEIATALVAPGKGILAADESIATFACANLAAINAQAAAGEPVPWRLTFSFGRALVEDALRAWRGIPAQVAAAQAELAGNCQRASAASSPAATPVRT
jgi:fructose-bisphosphate aldolase class I